MNKGKFIDSLPSIYNYFDYRVYLDVVYVHMKKHHGRFSLRSFARMANSPVPNFLKLIINGSLNINSRIFCTHDKGV